MTTYELLAEALAFVGQRGHDTIRVVESDQRPPDRVAVRYRLEAFDEPVETLTRDPRTLDGRPISVTVPHLAKLVGSQVVDRPWAYAVPQTAARQLQQHGLAVRQLEEERNAEVEAATVESAASQASRKILEASASGETQIQASYQRETRRLRTGTFLVPTEQPLGAIAAYMREACGDDGLVACGLILEPASGVEFLALRVTGWLEDSDEPVDTEHQDAFRPRCWFPGMPYAYHALGYQPLISEGCWCCAAVS